MTSGEYQRTFDQLLQQGYRLVRVSGYEFGDEALYAAIWSQSEGPAFEARHGMTSNGYQSVFNDLSSKGYRLTWVSGYTVGGQPRYAAIFEKKSGPAWFARHGLTPTPIRLHSTTPFRKAFVCSTSADTRLTTSPISRRSGSNARGRVGKREIISRARNTRLHSMSLLNKA